MNEMITFDTEDLIGVKVEEKVEPYELVDENDPILHEVMPTFLFDGTNDPKEISKRLQQTLKMHRAFGIAAPQCGLRLNVIVIGAEGDLITMFNPRILEVSEETAVMEEMCLSAPFLSLSIKRPERVKVEYQNEKSERKLLTFSGLTARIFFHEEHHIRGITFDQVAKPLALKLGMKKREKRIKSFARELVQQRYHSKEIKPKN